MPHRIFSTSFQYNTCARHVSTASAASDSQHVMGPLQDVPLHHDWHTTLLAGTIVELQQLAQMK